MNKIKVRNLDSVEFEKTSHNAGLKKVVFSAFDVCSDITQVAYGLLKSGEFVEEHVHPTMEEFFYVINGRMLLNVDMESLELIKGDVLYIPHNTLHSFTCLEDCEFIYYGVSV